MVPAALILGASALLSPTNNEKGELMPPALKSSVAILRFETCASASSRKFFWKIWRIFPSPRFNRHCFPAVGTYPKLWYSFCSALKENWKYYFLFHVCLPKISCCFQASISEVNCCYLRFGVSLFCPAHWKRRGDWRLPGRRKKEEAAQDHPPYCLPYRLHEQTSFDCPTRLLSEPDSNKQFLHPRQTILFNAAFWNTRPGFQKKTVEWPEKWEKWSY